MGFTKKQRVEIYNKYGGRCGYCGEKIKYKDMQVDHIIPQRNFVWHIRNKKWIPEFLQHLTVTECDHIDNGMPSCRVCNKMKNSYPLMQFREELEMQVERARKTSVNYRMALKYKQIKEIQQPILFYFERLKIENYKQTNK